MGVVKQGLGCDFDQLHELVNEHKTLRNFLGHTDCDNQFYHYQTLVDIVSLLTPELLQKVNQLVVESGHTAVGKKPDAPLRGRRGSFVVETRAFCKTQANSSSDIASLHDDWILVSTLHDSLDLAAKFRPDSTKNPFKPSKRV